MICCNAFILKSSKLKSRDHGHSKWRCAHLTLTFQHCLQAVLALDSQGGGKSKEVREGGARILGYAVLKLSQLDSIAGTLVDSLNKNETLAAAAAEVAQIACARFGDDRLVSDRKARHICCES